MPNYNNNGNYRNVNNYQNNIPRFGPAGSNGWNNGYQNGYQNGTYPVNGFQTNSFNQAQTQQVSQMPQMQADDRVFVAGRIGADAYQLQPGVNVQVLWDDDVDRFYIKGYDEKGRPRVLGDFDFIPHVESDYQQNSPDMSEYVTKDDIRNMISEAFKKNKTNTNNFVTTEALNKALSELCVGNGGKIVRTNESDA